jgi:SAM-dependent methyltransferase
MADRARDESPAPAEPTAPGWEESAAWWIRDFTDGADPEYRDQILPIVAAELADARRIIDIGCGEGQLARMLAGAGAQVTGVDSTRAQLETAVRRGGGPHYVRSSATALAVADHSFDAAVVCLVFEHLDDLDAAVAEVARVVRPGGRFALFINHPLTQTPGSGWIDDQILDPPEQYWRVGAYLVETATIEQVDAGVYIRFVHRPLSRYINTCAHHGLLLEHMVEPSPPESFLAQAPEYREAATIPRLMYLRFVNSR